MVKFLIIAFTVFGFCISQAQQFKGYQYDNERTGTTTEKGPKLTYDSFYNNTNKDSTFRIDATYQSCWSYSFGADMVRLAFNREKNGCNSHTYSASVKVQPKQTATTYRQDITDYEHYKVRKLAVYNDGSYKVVDTWYGTNKVTYKNWWTEVK